MAGLETLSTKNGYADVHIGWKGQCQGDQQYTDPYYQVEFIHRPSGLDSNYCYRHP